MSEISGYRFISRHDRERPAVGETLPASNRWEGDKPTDDVLPGTCAFARLSDVRSYAKHSKGQGWVVALSGDITPHRGDLPGEIFITDATVVSVEDH